MPRYPSRPSEGNGYIHVYLPLVPPPQGIAKENLMPPPYPFRLTTTPSPSGGPTLLAAPPRRLTLPATPPKRPTLLADPSRKPTLQVSLPRSPTLLASQPMRPVW